jgi:hypothetical protein
MAVPPTAHGSQTTFLFGHFFSVLWLLGWNVSKEGSWWPLSHPLGRDYLGSDRLPGAAFSGLHLTRIVVDLPELQDWVTSLDL